MARDDLIWSNPVLGTRTYFDHDEQDIVLETVQDIEPIIEANKAILNNVDASASSARFGDGKLVAQIPIVIMLQLVSKGILSPKFAVLDEKRFSAWINDPENRYFRTFPGTV
jgi:hypothetical protein